MGDQTHPEVITGEMDAQANSNSLKCDDCQRLLKNAHDAQLHAERTGHMNFSESTESVAPLTEEEKKQKLEELKAKLEAKRAERKALEAAEQLEREKMRRTSGKEISAAKQKLQEEEMKKALELKRREKEEERLARARIKAQIEDDKKARQEKLDEQRRLREGHSIPQPASAAPLQVLNATTDHQESRLQIRSMTNKPPLILNLKATDTLQAVCSRILQEGYAQTFTLSTTFPRKEFGTADMDKTLKDLGLIPSAALVLKEI